MRSEDALLASLGTCRRYKMWPGLPLFSMRSALPAMSLSPSPSTTSPHSDPHSCDTLPPARPSSPSLSIPDARWSSRSPSPSHPPLDLPSVILSQPTSRKLCIRHQRIADEGTNLKLQQVRSLAPTLFYHAVLPSLPESFPPFILLRVANPDVNLLNICGLFFFRYYVPGPR
jgi:hypothetical protein